MGIRYSDEAGTSPLVQLWLLRLLIHLGRYEKFFSYSRHIYISDRFSDATDDPFDFLMEIFNIDMQRCKTANNEIDSQKVLKCLRSLYETAEKQSEKTRPPEPLAGNVERLSKLLKLSPTDSRLLEFAILIHSEEILGSTCGLFGDLSSKKVFEALSVVLDLPQTDVRRSLSKNSILSRSGLVTLEKHRLDVLKDKLELLSSCFADNMVSSDEDPVDLLREAFFIASPSHLTIDDYPHLAGELGILQSYLRKSIETKRQGVNILLYGDSGTGKSQLARILAVETGCDLFEIASEDDEGGPIMDKRRLRAFQAAQSILSNRGAMILFDEIEDVFDSGNRRDFSMIFGPGEAIRNPKAWINRRLEGNPVPTLWLANLIGGLAPAFIRRFDMSVRLPVPPKKQRKKILRQTCSNLLGEQDIERISGVEALAPAVVTRAASVVASIQDALSPADQASALELIINNTLEAQGHKRILRHDPNRLPETWDAAFIHADTSIEDIAAGLQETRAGRLCLYGPSGTGKTTCGRWLAEQLEVPLLVKRGSDLISPWVGGTEQNIARSFYEAETGGALLLIDEVEGFLHERREAMRNWEVTGVNEMLTQMEAFPGVFIASTNFIDNLDQAALRRFELKIKFDFLRAGQVQALLESHCNNLNLEAPDETLTARLGRLNNVTPGDFAAIVRRHRIKPICSAGEMLSALEKECGLKENLRRPVGFC